MKVYIIMCSEEYGDSWIDSIYTKKEDAELALKDHPEEEEEDFFYHYYIVEQEVIK